MLKIHESVKSWPPAPDKVDFSDRSSDLLKRDQESAHHDRTTEIGVQVGDFLGNSMIQEAAFGIADKLAGDLTDSEQSEALILGISNILPGYREYKDEQAVAAGGDLEAIPTLPQHEDGGVSGL